MGAAAAVQPGWGPASCVCCRFACASCACSLLKTVAPLRTAGTTSLPAELNRILNSIKDLDERSDGERRWGPGWGARASPG